MSEFILMRNFYEMRLIWPSLTHRNASTTIAIAPRTHIANVSEIEIAFDFIVSMCAR